MTKGRGGLRATAAVKDAWRLEQHTEFSVRRMCQLLELSARGYDEWRGRSPRTAGEAEPQVQARVQP